LRGVDCHLDCPNAGLRTDAASPVAQPRPPAQLQGEDGEGGADSAGVSLRDLCARREKRGSKGSHSGGDTSSGDEGTSGAGDAFGSLASALTAIISAPSARSLGRAADGDAPAQSGAGRAADRGGAQHLRRRPVILRAAASAAACLQR
jgi:hypothetical protein